MNGSAKLCAKALMSLSPRRDGCWITSAKALANWTE